MKRYWFILYPDDPYCAGNIGVTANSKAEAINLAIESLGKMRLSNYIENLNEHTECIENIDVRLLDQNHVIPNMGVVVWKGVWWPNLSFQDGLY